MKRSNHTRTILFACAVAISFIAVRFTASSAPVDSVALKQVVRNFYMTRVGNRAASANLSPQLVYTGKALAPQSGDSIACYQIYNIGNGFVIISTDDRTNPILGYSTEGCLDIRKIPIQLQELLQGYASELQVLLAQPAHTDAETAAKWRALASGSTVPTRHEGHVIVSPLVPPTHPDPAGTPSPAVWPPRWRRSSDIGSFPRTASEATAMSPTLPPQAMGTMARKLLISGARPTTTV